MRHVVLLLAACAAARAQGPLDPASPEWKAVAPVSLALNRTPPLYPTDAPASLDISSVQLQVLRAGAGTFVRLEWADKSRDSASLPKAERAWQGEHLVTQSDATDRFSDACALMLPARPGTGDLNPSLQMGDPAHPVRIFFWDATRGAAVMEASGRETTKRNGQTFPSRSAHTAGKWSVVMQLPDIPAGTPVALAVWNGAQQDRDGRKYFTIWRRLP